MQHEQISCRKFFKQSPTTQLHLMMYVLSPQTLWRTSGKSGVHPGPGVGVNQSISWQVYHQNQRTCIVLRPSWVGLGGVKLSWCAPSLLAEPTALKQQHHALKNGWIFPLTNHWLSERSVVCWKVFNHIWNVETSSSWLLGFYSTVLLVLLLSIIVSMRIVVNSGLPINTQLSSTNIITCNVQSM